MIERNAFEEDGFKTGFVVLPGMNIGMNLEPNQWFRYDGPVKSLEKYIESLPPDIRGHLEGFKYKGYGGFNFELATVHHKGFFMATRDISPRANTFTQAHEAAEVAVRAGRTDILQEYVTINARDKQIHLPSLGQHEVGNVCGFLATIDAGYSKDEIVRLITDNQDYTNIQLLERLRLI